MKLAIGVDLIEIERVQGVIIRHGAHFMKRIFTQAELNEVAEQPASLAARFAAKEAAAKALGTGIGRIGWQEIEVLYGPSREPCMKLSGGAAVLAGELGLQKWSVSLSHTHSHAIAMVVATSD
jgi:holo-[acyl-carrier protein] synthase